MSALPTLHDLDEPEARELTLFDSLARLVPEELQTAYYRVLAHTRTLSPDDEMLRILEAMGILALLTRHTPKDIANERERIQQMLDSHIQFSGEAQQKMLGYVHFIEDRLASLPCQVEAGLDPQQIARLLGESLRQHFVQSGVQDTVAGLRATATAMAGAQTKLTRALTELSDSRGGVVAQVESANWRISNTLEERTKVLDSFLREFKTNLLCIWMPIVAGATMIVGLFAGMSIQGCRDSRVQPNASISLQERSCPLAPPTPPQIEAGKKITSPSSINSHRSHLLARIQSR
jgi:hypothetical protein